MTDDVDAAVAEIVRFYANYRSSLPVRRRPPRDPPSARPDAATLARLNGEFADLLAAGPMALSGALPEESDEDAALPRVVARLRPPPESGACAC